MIKKFILSLLIVVQLFASTLVLAVPAMAAEEAGPWHDQTFGQWYSKVYDEDNPDEIFGERYTTAQVQWIIYGLLSFLLRLPVEGNEAPLNCLIGSDKDISECIPLIEEALDKLNDLIGSESLSNQGVAYIFNSRPMSGVGYLKQKLSNLGLVKEVQAQGFGFGAVQPIQELWSLSRDISFAFLAIVVVVIAFMIMFRMKISPQVVISIQSALPKIALSIFLISFSYAIAGLFIDLMYVLVGIVSLFFARLSSFSAIEIFSGIATDYNILGQMLRYWMNFVFASLAAIVSNGFLGALPSLLLFVFSIFSYILLMWYGIKTIILLLKTYVMILLQIIIAPFYMLLGAINPNFGFSSWAKSFMANLAVYPMMILLLLLSFFFLEQGTSWGSTFWQFKKDLIGTTVWTPPLTFGNDWGEGTLVWLIVSFSIIVMIPKTVEVVQGLISGKPIAFGSAIGEAAQSVTNTAKGATSWAVASREEGLGRSTTIGSVLRTLGIIKR